MTVDQRLRERAEAIGWMSLRSESPADVAMALLCQDIAVLIKHGTEEMALEMSMTLGRALLAWCRENFGPVDLDRLAVLFEFVLEARDEARKHGAIA